MTLQCCCCKREMVVGPSVTTLLCIECFRRELERGEKLAKVLLQWIAEDRDNGM